MVRNTILLFKGSSSESDNCGSDISDKFLDVLRPVVEEIGWSVSNIPVLDFEFCSLDALWNQLQNPSEFEGIILTSPRSLHSISKAIQIHREIQSSLISIENQEVTFTYWKESLCSNWSKKRIFCVGPTTEKLTVELFNLGHSDLPSNFITSTIGTSEDLANTILRVAAVLPINLPLLYPCGNLKTETLGRILEQSGVPITPITTYFTKQNPELESLLASTLPPPSSLEVANIICVFFSPSGVRFAFPFLKELHNSHFIALGTTTFAELRNQGVDSIKIFTCSRPTPEALRESILGIIKTAN